MRTHLLCLVGLLAGAALLAAPAGAKDEPSAYEAKLAQLPAPSKEHAFEFDGDFVAGGNPMGSVHMHARPVTRSGATVWEVQLSANIAGGAFVVEETTLFTARLQPIEGRHAEEEGGKKKTLSWSMTPTGVRIVTAGGGAEPKDVAHQGPFVAPVPALLLFCRLSGFPEGTYKADVFDVDKGTFIAAEWTLSMGTWGEARARVLRGKRADGKKLDAGFDATTGAVLGVRMADGERVSEFRPKSKDAKKADLSVYGRPAKTPQEAAVQAGLGFAIADLDLLERVTNWSAIFAQHKKEAPGYEGDADKLKAEIMADFRKKLKPHGKREILAPMLANAIPGLEAQKKEHGTVVSLGAMFGNVEIVVGEVAGNWYMIQFPGAPK